MFYQCFFVHFVEESGHCREQSTTMSLVQNSLVTNYEEGQQIQLPK